MVNASFILFRGVGVYTLQDTPDAGSGGDCYFSPAAEHTVPQLLVMAQALRKTLLVCSLATPLGNSLDRQTYNSSDSINTLFIMLNSSLFAFMLALKHPSSRVPFVESPMIYKSSS